MKHAWSEVEAAINEWMNTSNLDRYRLARYVTCPSRMLLLPHQVLTSWITDNSGYRYWLKAPHLAPFLAGNNLSIPLHLQAESKLFSLPNEVLGKLLEYVGLVRNSGHRPTFPVSRFSSLRVSCFRHTPLL